MITMHIKNPSSCYCNENICVRALEMAHHSYKSDVWYLCCEKEKKLVNAKKRKSVRYKRHIGILQKKYMNINLGIF